MGKKNKIVIIFCLLLSTSYAQEIVDKLVLSSVLAKLQEQYNIQFNYAEDMVADVFIKAPSKSMLLDELLAYLEINTQLSFTAISDNIILIEPKDTLSLCGYLKDKDTNTPMASATIQTRFNGTTSNENGFFKIEVNSNSELVTINYLGYKTIRKPYSEFQKNNCEILWMEPDFLPLSEIVISNYITTGINKINNGSFEIDFTNFDILPGLIDNDVLQSVQAFPGIISVNETVSNINIRGGTHDQNLILWDDIKMYQSGHFFGLISMYHPQITQKVSLRKNGTDVSYTDGVSGTIAMNTEETLNDTFSGVIGVNLTDANGFLDTPIGKKSSLQIAARTSISNFVETPTYTSYFDRISQNTEVAKNSAAISNTDKTFDFYDTSLRWIYKISDKDELRLNFINVQNELKFDENALVNNQNESRTSQLNQSSIAGALHYDRIWNSKFQTTFEVYETDYLLKATNANILDSQRFLQENKVSETSIKLKTNYKLYNNLHLLGGYHFVETQVTNLDDVDNPLFRLLVSEVVRTHGVFSELGYKSQNRSTNLNVGIRYNYIDKFQKSIIEPRLSFSQQFLKHLTLEILGEFKHQNTSQVVNFQNDFLGIEKRRWQLSNNKDIPVMESKQASLGISYSKKGWLLNAEGYYKLVDGITSQSQGFQNQYEFAKSVGNYDVKGVDLLFRKQLRKFNSWLSYTYMTNQYHFKDLEPNRFSSNYDITHSATLGLAYSLKNFKISSGLNWHSGKPITQPVKGNEILAGSINYASTNASKLEDYMRLDISATYNFKLGRSSIAYLGISVWNLLNKENEINSFYKIDNESLSETIQRSLGLTPNAILSISF
jgi:TonB-dependent Receptor Plug Domain